MFEMNEEGQVLTITKGLDLWIRVLAGLGGLAVLSNFLWIIVSTIDYMMQSGNFLMPSPLNLAFTLALAFVGFFVASVKTKYVVSVAGIEILFGPRVYALWTYKKTSYSISDIEKIRCEFRKGQVGKYRRAAGYAVAMKLKSHHMPVDLTRFDKEADAKKMAEAMSRRLGLG